MSAEDDDVPPMVPEAMPPAHALQPHRGMDSTLSRMMPDLTDMTKENYRTKRRKLEIFERACRSRGQEATTEGALMLLNSLEGDKWQSLENINLNEFDRLTAFETFYKIFDRDYQFDPETEMPARIEELVTKFHRLKHESLRKYVMRLQQNDVKLKELGINFPEEFMGWLMLNRAALPNWQIPNVKSAAGKKMDRMPFSPRCITCLGLIQPPTPKMCYEHPKKPKVSTASTLLRTIRNGTKIATK